MNKRYWKRKDGERFNNGGPAQWTISHSVKDPDATGAVQLYSPHGYYFSTCVLTALQECDERGKPLTPEQPVPNPKRHPHADIIHAWAEGAEIQVRVHGGEWQDIPHTYFYRVKPDLSKERAELAEVEAALKEAQDQARKAEITIFQLKRRHHDLREVLNNG